MIIRCLICIPTYNNSGSIAEVVAETLKASELPILILDDGSDTPIANLLPAHERVSIHRFEKNQGKGAAIQKCFEIALSRGFTHIVTMDGDGQHKPHDLKNMVEAILTNPWSLIIGQRQFSGENVPKISEFGRKFSNFWVKYQTDQTVHDSQSGFRAYPLFHVQDLNFFTKKYDFEIEVLIRLMWKKVQVKEVVIDVYYPPANERVSHFDKLRDNAKISILNTVLVILSLFHSNMSRKKIVASVALGVFVAVLPIYGFQMFIAAFLSFVFRLNFPLMFLAQQISLPPLIPVWTFISLVLGSALTGESLLISFDNVMAEAARLLPVWIMGSVALGFILAFLSVILTLALTKKKKEQKIWTGKDRGGKFGNWFMQTATNTFGPKFAYGFLFFICPYFYLFAPKAVYSHNQYFRITQPEVGLIKRQFLIVKCFFQFGQVLVDNFYSNDKGANYYSVVRTGKEQSFKALAHNKGLVLVGAHTGGWMLATKNLSIDEEDGKRLQVNVIQFFVGAGKNTSDKIEDKSVKYIVSTDEAPVFKINQALTQNEIVIFMADRLVNQNLVLVPFFGKLAPFDIAGFKIALTKKAPVSFSFGFKNSTKEYQLYITEPIYMEEFADLSRNEAIVALASKYAEKLEHFLRMYPTQWFNFYPFWSAIPSTPVSEHSRESRAHLV